MRFLERIEIVEWCTSNGIALDADGDLKLDPRLASTSTATYATSGRSGLEPEVAAAAVDALGSFDSCLLWAVGWGIWPSSEDWPAFYALREDQNERRSIDQSPGHLFGSDEADSLLRFLTSALENGWDAQVIPMLEGVNARRLRVSHDGYVELASIEPQHIARPV